MAERTIDRVVRTARDRGLNDVETARALGVEKQVFSNWKRRGMPAALNQRAAEFIGCTIDDLVGRPIRSLKVAETRVLYGYGLTEDGAHIGAEWQKLDPPVRTQIGTLIETLVARQVRDGRAKSSLPQTAAKQRTTNRDA